MSNSWSAPVIKPLAKLVELFRIQLAGAPVAHVEDAVAGIVEHVEQVVRAAVEPLQRTIEQMASAFDALKSDVAALRDEVAALKAGAPASAEGPDLFAEIREEIAALRARFDQIQPAPATEVSGDLKALHDRVVALETTKPAAPARAAAPAARPATTA